MIAFKRYPRQSLDFLRYHFFGGLSDVWQTFFDLSGEGEKHLSDRNY